MFVRTKYKNILTAEDIDNGSPTAGTRLAREIKKI